MHSYPWKAYGVEIEAVVSPLEEWGYHVTDVRGSALTARSDPWPFEIIARVNAHT
jgi:hypothetical protein